jgi:uncharacterized membrane protein
MEAGGLGAMGGFMLAVTIFAIILAIAWIIMPFAIIGTKPILRDLLAEQKRTNRLLEEAAARAGTRTP